MKARSTTQQGRLDTFFSVSRTVSAAVPNLKKKTEAPEPTNKGLKRKAAATTDTKPKGKSTAGSAKKPKTK